MKKYGSVADGKFVVGNCAYSNVIVPYCRTLTASTKALLKEFIAAGGHVYLYEGAPEFTEGVADDYSFLTEKLAATVKANEEAAYRANPIKENVAFEDFQKLDIRVGTVLECERVPKMKKLLKFKIDDGLECRTIVSGISQWYEPEALVGKQVLFIANLAPRAFKNGLVSEGMILSAENFDGSISVTTVEHPVKPGSQVC